VKRTITIIAVLAVALMACAGSLAAKSVERFPSASSAFVRDAAAREPQLKGARLETLWIFDADFENLTGDNAGWSSGDQSGTLAVDNYWHHDTIRINGYAYLGDSTWWCGTYNSCWRQARGYGNDWTQILERHFYVADDLVGQQPRLRREPGQVAGLEQHERRGPGPHGGRHYA
jgi:hypothetical protein